MFWNNFQMKRDNHQNHWNEKLINKGSCTLSCLAWQCCRRSTWTWACSCPPTRWSSKCCVRSCASLLPNTRLAWPNWQRRKRRSRDRTWTSWNNCRTRSLTNARSKHQTRWEGEPSWQQFVHCLIPASIAPLFLHAPLYLRTHKHKNTHTHKKTYTQKTHTHTHTHTHQIT